MPPLDHPVGHWHILEGPGNVLMVTFELTVVPTLFRPMSRSSRVVLVSFLTFLMIFDSPRGENLHGGHLEFPDNANSCLLIKLLAYSPVAHHSLMQVFSGLAHSGELGAWMIKLVEVYLYTSEESKQVLLTQVRSGGQEGFLNTSWRVCDSQNSCLLPGDQILIPCNKILNSYLKVIQCNFQIFLNSVCQVNLWWKLWITSFFVRGKTCNKYLFSSVILHFKARTQLISY